MKKISESRRMWVTYIAASVFTIIGIYAIHKEMEMTANIVFGGGIAIIMAYLGVESWKPSKH